MAAYGVFAQSVGGGGGDGGAGLAASFGTQAKAVDLALAIGRSGGSGGKGGDVAVNNASVIDTEGIVSHGIAAQSIGGGGGNGGFSAVGTLSTSTSAKQLSVSLGGSGGDGGSAGNVSVTNSGRITTLASVKGDIPDFSTNLATPNIPVGSVGILAQSIGGGGGNGGTAFAGTFAGTGPKNISVAVGGGGGDGNSAGAVTVENSGVIETWGTNSHGVLAQSIGGGGGNGGSAISLALATASGTDTYNVNVGVSFGGGGGDGGFGGDVKVVNGSNIVTRGESSHGIFAQSVGGGGGAGGASLAITGGWNNQSPNVVNLSLAVGGAGGDGNHGGTVDVVNHGNIETSEDASYGILAQSVGGGGGVGGNARAVTVMVDPKDWLPGEGYFEGLYKTWSIAVGGHGGGASDGGIVSVTNVGSIKTKGADAYGILAQSVGGGGLGGAGEHGIPLDFLGDVGSGISDILLEFTPFKDFNAMQIVLGGSGGSSGNGNNATVNNTGTIETLGDGAHGILAQSVGGGGGLGGKGAVGLVGKVGLGGAGGTSGNGGNVTVAQSGDITTSGKDANGITAQSVGGGGGMGGSVDRGIADLGIGLAIGQGGGNAGNGGTVTVASDGNITTLGSASYGIFAQSVGGGGGVAGGIGNGLGFAGSTGGHGDGGQVSVTHSGDITTYGTAADGIFAQSAGGADIVTFSVGDFIDPATFVMKLKYQSNAVSAYVRGRLSVSTRQAVDGYPNSGLVSELMQTNLVNELNSISHGVSIYDATRFAGVALRLETTQLLAQDTPEQPLSGADLVRLNRWLLEDAYPLELAGNFKAGIALGVGGPVDITVTGDITAHGTNASGILAQSTGVNGAGDITINVLGSGTVHGGSGSNAAGVRIEGGVNNTLTNYGTITTLNGTTGVAIRGGSGNERVENYGTLVGQVLLGGGVNFWNNHPGSVFNVETTFSLGAGNTFDNQGLVKGSGQIIGNVVSAGVITPGNSAGSLTIDGSLNLLSSANMTFEIGGQQRGTSYDFVRVTNFVQFAGTLSLSLTNAFRPTSTDTFTLMEFGSRSGLFDNVLNGGRLLTLNNLASFELNYTSTNLVASAFQSPDSDGDGVNDYDEFLEGTDWMDPNAGGLPGWGSALSFDGNDDRVQTTPFTGFPSNEITVEFWMKSSDITKTPGLVSYAVGGSGADANEFVIFNHQNLQVNIGNVATNTGLSVKDVAWHHVAVSWKSAGGLLDVYVDGVNRFSRTNHRAGYNLRSDGCLVLAQEQDALGGGFDVNQAFLGEMDEFRVWNVTRSATEILGDMKRRLNGRESGLVLYWRFNAGAGSTMVDVTGNGHRGTLTNGPVWVSSTVPTGRPVLMNWVVAESQPSGTTVGALSTTDPDLNRTFMFALVSGEGSTDNASFAILGSTLQTAAMLDYETKNSYSIRVGATNQSDLSVQEMSFTVTVADTNDPPTDIALTPSSVSENQPIGTTVGTFGATDPNPDNTHTFSLVSGTGGADNASFTITGNTLRTTASFDYETKNTYSIRVRATDQGALTFDKELTITVTDSNDPPTNITLNNSSVAENQPPGTTVGTFGALDQDSGDTHAFALVSGSGGADNASFTITGNTLQTAASFDRETKSIYSIRVRATDTGGLSVTNIFTISVLNTPETLIVANTGDSGAGSLRAMLGVAAAGDTITFNAPVTGTIGLTSGQLTIAANLNLIGPGATNLAVSGSGLSRVFAINAGVTVSISGLTISNGQAPNAAWEGEAGQPGGGIYNAGDLTLSECVITNSRAGAGGTGVHGGTGNSGGAGGAGGNGGGIYNHSSGVLAVNRCMIIGNFCGTGGTGGFGGAGANGTFYGDDGASGGVGGAGGTGGGIYNAGAMTGSLSTLAGNQAGAGGTGGHGGNGGTGWLDDGAGGRGGNGGIGGIGGGVFNANSLALVSSTIAYNAASSGGTGGTPGSGEGNGGSGSPGTSGSAGGVHNYSGALAQLLNTLVGTNTTPFTAPDVSGAFASQGHNLISRSDGSTGFTHGVQGDLVGTVAAPLNPQLGPLANNGGPTRTCALLAGSPAIDAGDDAACTATDQRGVARPQDGNGDGTARCDIGAYEVPGSPTDIVLSSSSVAENQPAGTSIGTLTATDSTPGDTHTFALVAGTGSGDNAAFTIAGTALQTAAIFNYEVKNSFSIRVRATDRDNLTFEKQFIIAATDLNEAPTDIALGNASVAENQPAGTIVGTLSATDPDAGNTHAFTLASGTGSEDNGSFTIVGNALKTAASFNYENKNSYSVRVRATDQGSLSYEKQFTITVTDGNEAPSDIVLGNSSVSENQPAATTVGTLTATDPDAGNTFSFALVSGAGSTDNTSFTITANAIKTAASFNYETKSSYSIRVRVTDQGSLTYEKPFTITVTDVNDAPVLDNSKTPVLANIFPGAGAPSGAVGTAVTNLVARGSPLSNVTDADAGAVTGMAILGANAANGTWYYTIDNGVTWNLLGTPSVSSARLLSSVASSRIYFQPNAGFSGTVAAALTFRAWDRTTGSNGGTADTTSNGGTTAFSTATDTADVNVATIPGWSSALSFDGSDDYVEAYPFTGFPSTQITLEMWLQTTNTKFAVPFAYATATEDNMFTAFFRSPSGQLQLVIGGTGGDSSFGGPLGPAIQDGQWHHVAMVWQSAGGLLSFYLDGLQVHSTNGFKSGYSIPDGGALILAQDQDSLRGGFQTTQAFHGQMDEVRLWNVVRSAAEIQADMKHRLAGTETGLVVCWRFDEGAGSTTVDATGNGHAGTVTNGPVWVSSTVPVGRPVLSSASVAENQPSGTAVGSLSATDPDQNRTYAYALVSGAGDTDNASFAMAGSTLQTAASFNYEVKNSYSMRVRATDQGDLSEKEMSLTISVTDVNDAPTNLAVSSSAVAENLASGTTVGTLSATDPDTGNTFTFVLASGAGDTDNASFTIAGTALKTAANFNYETKSSYSIRVRATDQGGLTYEKQLTITVTDVNEAPTNLAVSSSAVAENLASGTTVGTLSATDPDTGNTFTFALVSGTGGDDNASFTITGTGLKTAASFNYETKSSYSIRVRVTDQGGLTYEKQLTISVTDVNEAPTNLAVSSSAVAENLASGTTVGTLSATDPDTGNTFTFVLASGAGDTDNASFTIAGTALKTAANFNYETKSSYSIRVRATDQGGLTYEKQLTITVTDVNETPTNLAVSSSAVAENLASGTTVGTLSATDPDTGNTFTFALASGTGDTDNGSFTITGTALKTTASFNYESKSSYSIRVRATDQGGLTFEKQLTITVTDVNEAPTDVTLNNSSVSENQPAATTVGTLTATDPDTGNTFTFALVSGAGSTDNTSFTITANALKTAASFNYETKSSYSIRVRVTDQGSLTYEEPFIITVTDVNDAPALDNSKTPALAGIFPGAGTPSGAVGTPMTSLVAIGGPLGNVTDADASAVTGVAILGVNAANGSWYYTTDNGTNWSLLGTPSASSARLLSSVASSRIYFQPNAGFSGTVAAALTFRAWDQTTGSNGGTADTTSNGGTTAFSTATDTTDLSVVTVPGWSSALEFDGTNHYVSLPLILPDTGTIELWYYVEPYDNYQTLFDNSSDPNDWEMWIYPTTTEVRFRLQDGDCRYDLDNLEGRNHWYHFAVTWQKHDTEVDYRLYVNGVQRAAVSNQAWVAPGSTFYLAGGNPGNVKGNGQMDEVRLWNVARSGAEIQSDMKHRLTGTEVGLMVYWRFDEGAGSTTVDATGNGHTGTLVSGPTWLSSTVPIGRPVVSNALVAENQPSGTTVGSLSATDPDQNRTYAYALVSGAGDTDNASFAIAGSTLQTAASFNYELKNSYSVRLRATDQGDLSEQEMSFVIAVTDVNEAPTNLAVNSSAVAENLASGTTVGTLSATDPDTGNTFTFALASGTGDMDNASFTITGATLKTAASFNYETKSSYSIRVRATDQGGLTFEKQLTITVTDVNEAPTNLAASSSSVAENQASGTTVGTLSATDPDTGNTFTFALVSGTGGDDNASFTIAGTALKTAASFNYESKSSYSTRVRATDQGGLTFEKQLTITITDANDAPVAGFATYNRDANMATKIPVSDLLNNFTSDPDNDTRTLASVGPGTNNAAISKDSNYIYYEPSETDPNRNTTDHFSYQISDGRGGTAANVIRLTVGTGGDPGSQGGNIVAIETVGNHKKIKFRGIPHYTYRVQRTELFNGASTVWMPLPGTAAEISPGYFEYEDASPPGTAYYRTVWP